VAQEPGAQAGRTGPVASAGVNWDADFAGLPPIDLPDGRKLETLADCRAYILALPRRDQARWEAWRPVSLHRMRALRADASRR
jgi:hypothetical protein